MNRNRWKMILMAVWFTFLLSLKVMAQEGDEIRLDETGKVTLISKEAAREGVSSLQIGLRVDSAEGEKVEFIFAESNAKISEFRYDGEVKQWNLYLAGTEALFAEGSDTLTLGRVTVLNGNGEAAAATVSVVEDSVWYVYGTELRAIDALKLPEPVVINAKEDDTSGEDDDEGEDTPGGDDNEGDDIPDQGEGQGTASTPAPAGNAGQETVNTPKPAGNAGQGTASTPKPAGNEGQGAASTPKPAGNKGQGAVSTPKPAGNAGQGAANTPKPAGNAGQGAVNTPKPAGSEGQGASSTPKPAGNAGQGMASGSQGNQSISPTVSPQGSIDKTVSSSSSVQPANAESTGKGGEKNAAGVDWGIVLIILAIFFAAVFGVAAAMLIVKVITRRR